MRFAGLGPAWAAALGLAAALLSGCASPQEVQYTGSSGYSDEDYIRLDIVTSYDATHRRNPPDASDRATDLPAGTPASNHSIDFFVYDQTRAPPGWPHDAGCPTVDKLHGIVSCEGYERKAYYVLPPPNEGHEYAVISLPLDSSGRIQGRFPGQLDLDVSMGAPYPPEHREQMADPQGCREPWDAGGDPTTFSGTQNVTSPQEFHLVVAGDAGLTLYWFGACHDDIG